MEFSVKMQPELMMNTLWITIGGLLFLLSAVLFILIIIFKMAPRKVKVHKKKPVAQRPKFVNSRQKALFEIDQIVFDLSKSKIDTRASYQRLSLVLREYLTETTGKDHTCLTLEEIKKLTSEDLARSGSRDTAVTNTTAANNNINPNSSTVLYGYGNVGANIANVNVKSPDLRVSKIKEFTALIEGCYNPEFALKTKRDFRIDADRAKRLVNTWS